MAWAFSIFYSGALSAGLVFTPANLTNLGISNFWGGVGNGMEEAGARVTMRASTGICDGAVGCCTRRFHSCDKVYYTVISIDQNKIQFWNTNKISSSTYK